MKMDAFFQLFTPFWLAALISTITNNLSIFLLICSNSIIRLLLLTSLISVFTAGHRRLHYASLVTSVVAPILTIFSNILALVSPAVVPTLLSNFTFAAIVIMSVTFLIQVIAIFLAGFAHGVVIFMTSYIVTLYVMIQEKNKRKPGEPAITHSQLQDTVRSKIEGWCSDYGVMFQIYTLMSTVHLPTAIADSSVRYVALSYYGVLLPALQNAEGSATVTPKDIVVYAFTVALGMHISYNTIWTVCGSSLKRAGSDSRSSVIHALRSLSDVYWCLVTTGLIAAPFAEKELVGGTVKLFWVFTKTVLVDWFYRCLVAVSEMTQRDIPKWTKLACVLGVGMTWVRYGMILCDRVDDVNLKFAARYALS